MQDEPGVGRALADPAVGDDVLVGRDPLGLVERGEVLGALERAVLLDRLGPRDRRGARDMPGTLCGLAYPFNRGYPDQNGDLSPPNGQVFDEVYFPVDAYNDVKGIELCRPSTTDCRFNYFDPEPPLAKMFIAGGEWGYGWYRAHFEGAKGEYIDLGFNTFGWRIAACIFGILCIPMMYLFARRLWSNSPGEAEGCSVLALG